MGFFTSRGKVVLYFGGGEYKLGVGLFLYLSIGRRTGESFIIPHMGARQESVGLADASARLTRESFIIFILKLYYVNCDAKYIHRVQDEDVHHGAKAAWAKRISDVLKKTQFFFRL